MWIVPKSQEYVKNPCQLESCHFEAQNRDRTDSGSQYNFWNDLAVTLKFFIYDLSHKFIWVREHLLQQRTCFGRLVLQARE